MSARLPIERVLRLIEREGALSVPELTREMIPTPISRVRAAVNYLVRWGSLEPLGTSSTNARCYGIVKETT